MAHDLNFDPTTPEGQAIVKLFRKVKAGIAGEWKGGQDMVDDFTGWLTGLGFDLNDDTDPHPPTEGRHLRSV